MKIYSIHWNVEGGMNFIDENAFDTKDGAIEFAQGKGAIHKQHKNIFTSVDGTITAEIIEQKVLRGTPTKDGMHFTPLEVIDTMNGTMIR